MSNPREVFQQFYEAIQPVVAFDPKWNNGTGYYDYAVKADLGLKPGQMAKCESVAPNSRRIIFIGTRWGNVVLFERYSPKEDGSRSEIIVCNMPSRMERLCYGRLGMGSRLEASALDFLLGDEFYARNQDKYHSCINNIGYRIEQMLG